MVPIDNYIFLDEPPRRRPPPPPLMNPALDTLAPPVPARPGEDTTLSRDQMMGISIYQLGDRIYDLCHTPNGFKQEYMVSYMLTVWQGNAFRITTKKAHIKGSALLAICEGNHPQWAGNTELCSTVSIVVSLNNLAIELNMVWEPWRL